MDNSSFEQISMSNDIIGEKIKLLKENVDVTISLLDEKPLSIELPKNIALWLSLQTLLLKDKPLLPLISLLS